MIAFRKKHPVFRRLDFFRGRPVRDTGVQDVQWLNAHGKKMSDEDWGSDFNHCLGMFLSGYLTDPHGEVVQNDFFLLCFNAYHKPVHFILPAGVETAWEVVINTANENGFVGEGPPPQAKTILEGRSLTVLRLKPPEKLERSTIMSHLVQSMDPGASAIEPEYA